MQIASRKRTYLDPIHHDIVLDRHDAAERLIIDLIDTPEFQRLRRINQLGVSFFTFHGAEGSRFTHSLGVMHVALRLFQLLVEKTSSLASQKHLILASALLHDIGHGPFSHVTEKILGYHHEDWSCKIVAGATAVNTILAQFDPNLPSQIISVLRKDYKPSYICHLVSSQLDCDRFDYLLRDSHMTGTAYGLFALQRILSSLEIDLVNDCIVVSGEKGLNAVEDYLFARYSMYTQVYYHRKNLAARALLSKILNRARHLGDCVSFLDEPTHKWLSGEPITTEQYLFFDDAQVTYHIKRWTADPDIILSDLARRFLNRQLFNAIKLPPHNPAAHGTLAAKVKNAVSSYGLDPEYYVAIEDTGIRPYDYYRPHQEYPQTNIMVRTEKGDIKELSSLSYTVEALVKGQFDTSWLIYPSEAKEKVLKIFEQDLSSTPNIIVAVQDF